MARKHEERAAVLELLKARYPVFQDCRAGRILVSA